MAFLKEKRGDTYIFSVPSFTATGLVEHGFTCRLGGVSRGEFDSLNLGLHVGDDPTLVVKNRQKAVRLLNGSLDQLVAGEQVHGNQVRVVTLRHKGQGAKNMAEALPGTDALVTNVPGVMLSLYYADCVPIFFLDPFHQAIGLAHAGWKGTLREIGVHTLRVMQEYFGTDPKECLAAVGPSIGPCCYQVDELVYQKFAQRFAYCDDICIKDRKGKWSLDLWQANRKQLMQTGIRTEHITESGMCTSCQNDIFFSYRKDNGVTGRQASLIMLKGADS